MRADTLAWAIAGCVASLAAQGRMWVVDPANGPGTNFTSLAAAEAAAAHGDTLVLRAANYPFLITAKGIAILGTTGVQILGGTTYEPALTVKGLPAGKVFALRGARLVPASYVTALQLEACAGTVHIQDVDPGWGQCVVKGCADVTLTRLVVTSLVGYFAPLTLDSSHVVLADSRLIGAQAMPMHLGYVTAGGTALQCTGSELWLVDTSVTGGSGMLAQTGPNASPYPAITASSSRLRIRGTAATPIAAGKGNNLLPTPAIAGGLSTVEVDPAVPLVPFSGGPAIASATVTTRPLATLLCPAASRAGTLAPTLRSPQGDPYLLALGGSSLPAPGPLGTLFVDLTLWGTLAGGVQVPSGSTTWSFPVPADPALRGATLVLQAANAYSATSAVELTNPARFTLD